ncbi:MAG: DUF488 domain-containing protein [Candidatus Eremiobacteraeota bacterium]|nr:DUF488 domain-containing protein [Candidatus Eremiobacteraeota bacterium]
MLVTIAPLRLWTIGHGTRSSQEFLDALRGQGIPQLIDVRAHPGSRANPQFGKAALESALGAGGVAYDHWPALGGRRRGLGDASPNVAWQHPSFRAFADYMMTDEFWKAVDELLLLARERPTVIMCSETLWWRCHRRLIADAASARSAEVLHIMKPGIIAPHVLSPPARVVGDRVVYTTPG